MARKPGGAKAVRQPMKKQPQQDRQQAASKAGVANQRSGVGL